MGTTLLTKKAKGRKTKSRTIARPALWRIGFASGYILAAFVLFQFVSVQLAEGFYKSPTIQTQNPVALSAQASIAIIQAATTTKPTVGLPVRLKIPRIKVSAAITNVGLTSNGSMGIPKKPQDTAWYMLGPKPGEVGSAVIAGHLNWFYGATGSFEHLNVLKPGDKISVQDDKGIVTTFVVRKTRVYGKNENAADVFFSYDGKSHLNLVTCAGIWDKVSKAYSTRLVVFADKYE